MMLQIGIPILDFVYMEAIIGILNMASIYI